MKDKVSRMIVDCGLQAFASECFMKGLSFNKVFAYARNKAELNDIEKYKLNKLFTELYFCDESASIGG